MPRPPLVGLIDDLYYLEGVPPYARLTLPPMPSAVLILNLGEPFRIDTGFGPEEYADGCVITTATRSYDFAYPTYSRSIGVHFKPWGLAPFLPMPAAELRDRPLAVAQVWGRFADELRDRIAEAPGPGARLGLLEQALLRRLKMAPGIALVRHAGDRIAASSGVLSIGTLCDETGVSTTHLSTRFKQLVGITPKRLARTYRFAEVVLGVDPADRVNWTEVAHRSGYFDQSHFTKDFRAFTGHTPTAYLALRRRFQLEHPGNALDVGPLPGD